MSWSHRGAGRASVVIPRVPVGGVPDDDGPDGAATAHAPRDAARGAGWRERWPDIADALRAGTWGDGGRDH